MRGEKNPTMMMWQLTMDMITDGDQSKIQISYPCIMQYAIPT